MGELTLEALAARIEAIEKQLAGQLLAQKKDWRSVVGISEDNEFTRLMLAEIEENREIERLRAIEEPTVE
jgi:hypothetical protein